MESLRLDNIGQDVRRIIEPYLKKLLDIHKENIVSIVLYGSATGKYFVPKRSDINLLVVFNELGFSQLKGSLKLIGAGINKKIRAPLFLSISHIQTSKDTFPIEFMEIKENNILLYGRDLFKDMKIDESNTRLFCEREIKGKLIRLRQAFLEVGVNKKAIKALMEESMYSLMPIFRAIIQLKGQKFSIDKESVLIELCNHYNLDRGIFLAILKHRLGREKIAYKDVEVLFEKYLNQIQKLAEVVDGM